MKILVLIKQVPDTATQVKIGADSRAIDPTGITWIISPYDEFAVEEALRIKEKRGQGEVVAVSVGPDRVKEALRSTLAMGADRAVHVKDPAFDAADTLMTARALAAVVRQEAPALVLCGRQAIDDDMNATGQMLAALLGWPQGTFASKVEVADGIKVTREVDGGLETVALKLPAIVTADLRLNEPRYVTLPNIMKAKKKPIVEKTPDAYGVDVKPRLEIVQTVEPPRRKAGMEVERRDRTPGALPVRVGFATRDEHDGPVVRLEVLDRGAHRVGCVESHGLEEQVAELFLVARGVAALERVESFITLQRVSDACSDRLGSEAAMSASPRIAPARRRTRTLRLRPRCARPPLSANGVAPGWPHLAPIGPCRSCNLAPLVVDEPRLPS